MDRNFEIHKQRMAQIKQRPDKLAQVDKVQHSMDYVKALKAQNKTFLQNGKLQEKSLTRYDLSEKNILLNREN